MDLPSSAFGHRAQETELADQARIILQGLDDYDITLADQCLLSAVILDESYGQQKFTSRSLQHDGADILI